MARVGILGGTFNPPHVAHLVCAQEARWQLALERVLLVPTLVPPHKEAPEDPGAEVRLALCEAAAAHDPFLEVSRVELDRPGPSWTVDTLAGIVARSPEDELTFIAGGDMARSLPSWREPARILELATFAVAERAGVARADIRDQLSGLAGSDRIAFFDMPRLDVSSSEVRHRVAHGRPIRYLVPDAVAEAIESRRLYR
ncbi:MAG TPA: nicotinate-nucleotide adenylyltransferase [Solirubrobacteraceae bacterium]|nr:nicotinate-nucleotide adenylyltransferase [Solirubrobacteraceae bacterium]